MEDTKLVFDIFFWLGFSIMFVSYVIMGFNRITASGLLIMSFSLLFLIGVFEYELYRIKRKKPKICASFVAAHAMFVIGFLLIVITLIITQFLYNHIILFGILFMLPLSIVTLRNHYIKSYWFLVLGMIVILITFMHVKMRYFSIIGVIMIFVYVLEYIMKSIQVHEQRFKARKKVKRKVNVKINQTDLDKLHNMLKEKKSMKLNEIAKEFGVTMEVAEEWCNILDSHRLAEFKYPLIGQAEVRWR